MGSERQTRPRPRDFGPVQSIRDQNPLHSLHQPSTRSWQQRMAYWGPIVRSDFDVPEIARLTLGPDYTKLEPDQRQAFQELLTQYTAASYAHHFTNGKATIRIAGAQSLSPTTAAVLTQLQTEGGKRHTLDYVLMRDLNHS
ncbi:ABC transporter substrate-binding protein [Acidithiobacillus caldus]